jgi:hypothetical protein
VPKADFTVAAARSENSSCAGHRCLDADEIASGRAWLGRDRFDPNNEDGRDYDENSGQRLAHVQPLSSLDWIVRTERAGAM